MIKKATWKSESEDGFRVFRINNKPGHSIIIDGTILVAEVERRDMDDLDKDLEENECLRAVGSFFTRLGRFCWYCEDLETEEAFLYIESEED